MTIQRVYGWKKQPIDLRDWKYTRKLSLVTRPVRADLRPICPPVYDQGELGSCTGNGIAGDIEFVQKNFHGTEFAPSRLFIYFCERRMEGTVAQDAGANIRDGIKCVNQFGVCTEQTWPYNISKFTHKPSNDAFKEAVNCEVVQYEALTDLDSCKDALAQELPIVFGIMVYETFESDAVAKTGVVSMPDVTKEQCLGGHCILMVGYDDENQVVICRNSWGADWGMAGYFTLPYAYILDASLSSDFWVIQKLKQQPVKHTVIQWFKNIRYLLS